MTGWFHAVRSRKLALRESRRARAALDVALRELRSTYARRPLRFVVGAAAIGWALGRTRIGTGALQAAAGVANGRAWRLVQQLLMTMKR